MSRLLAIKIFIAVLFLTCISCYSAETANLGYSKVENRDDSLSIRSLMNRLESHDDIAQVYNFLENELAKITSNQMLQTQEKYRKMRDALVYLSSYLDTEIKTDPSDNSYKENLDQFKNDISTLYPSVYGEPDFQPYTPGESNIPEIKIKGEAIIIPNPFEVISSEHLKDILAENGWFVSIGDFKVFLQHLKTETNIEDPSPDFEKAVTNALEKGTPLTCETDTDCFIKEHRCGFFTSLDDTYGKDYKSLHLWLENNERIEKATSNLMNWNQRTFPEMAKDADFYFIPEVVYIFTPIMKCYPSPIVPLDFQLAKESPILSIVLGADPST